MFAISSPDELLVYIHLGIRLSLLTVFYDISILWRVQSGWEEPITFS